MVLGVGGEEGGGGGGGVCIFSESLKNSFSSRSWSQKGLWSESLFRFLRFPPNILSIRGMLICQK